MSVLPIAAKKQAPLPGAVVKARRQPPWFSVRILEEERPDLLGPDGKLNLEREDAILMDMFIRDKSNLKTGDLIITDDNLDEDDRRFNRYEVQLKYNEGRYTALYLISKQVCSSNEVEEKNTLYAMKSSLRPNSANIVLRMKRELRILNELKKSKCPYSPIPLDSGRVADLPFIVMNLLDRNLEKLREQTTTFRPSTVFYIGLEVLSALEFLHARKYIHRDVKLTNICIGARPAFSRIYLIDYGDTVKSGKKIRYGTPDIYTLPYWSLDAHKRLPARQRGDAESLFYVLAELLKNGGLPWIKLNTEADVQTAKQAIWKEDGQQIVDDPHMSLLQDLIQCTENTFDHETAKLIVRSAMETNRSGPLLLEWVPPSTPVNLPQTTATSIEELKAIVTDIKNGQRPNERIRNATEKAKAEALRNLDEITQKSASRRRRRSVSAKEHRRTCDAQSQKSLRRNRRSTNAQMQPTTTISPLPRRSVSARRAVSKKASSSKMMTVSQSKLAPPAPTSKMTSERKRSKPSSNKKTSLSKSKMMPVQKKMSVTSTRRSPSVNITKKPGRTIRKK